MPVAWPTETPEQYASLGPRTPDPARLQCANARSVQHSAGGNPTRLRTPRRAVDPARRVSESGPAPRSCFPPRHSARPQIGVHRLPRAQESAPVPTESGPPARPLRADEPGKSPDRHDSAAEIAASPPTRARRPKQSLGNAIPGSAPIRARQLSGFASPRVDSPRRQRFPPVFAANPVRTPRRPVPPEDPLGKPGLRYPHPEN